MSKEKMEKVRNVAEMFSGMSKLNQEAVILFMLGYQFSEEKHRSKEKLEKKDITKN